MSYLRPSGAATSQRAPTRGQRAGAAWQKHEYIFCTSTGTHLHPSKDVLDQLKALLKKVRKAREGKLPAILYARRVHSTSRCARTRGGVRP